MPILDPEQALFEALVAVWNADADLRTLFGRTVSLVRPWNAATLDGPLPVLVYTPLGARPVDFRVRRVSLQVTAFASSRSVASAAIARAIACVANTTLAARGVDACPDPENPPARTWLDPDATTDDAATARADVTLTLLLAP
jgi:hypothetical protein